MKEAKEIALFGLWFTAGVLACLIIFYDPRILHSPWIWLALTMLTLGSSLNYTAKFANNGLMPVRRLGPERIVASESHTDLTSETKFKCLCDIYCLELRGVKKAIFSLGDVLSSIGIAGLISIILRAAAQHL
jgi:hypothetical protein